jgi:preprotein translocase subunit SecA
MLNRGVSNAQKKVEERNFAMRKHLLEYDDVLNQQREIIYDLRNKALLSDSIKNKIHEFIEDYIYDIIGELDFKQIKEWDWQGINQELNSNILVSVDIKNISSLSNIDELIEHIYNLALKYYKLKEDVIPSELLRKVEKFIVLRTIDEKWRNHLLGMDQLREGIGLRAYGQKNPLIEYKSESYNFFQELMMSLRANVVQRVFHAQVSDQAQPQVNPLRKNLHLKHEDLNAAVDTLSSKQKLQPENSDGVEIKIGRNDKIRVISPAGEEKEIKFKKLESYLSKGYTRG